MELLLGSSFQAPLTDSHRYLVLCGGRGSGKSEFVARKILLRCMKEGRHRVLILRKVRVRLKESVLEVMFRLLKESNIEYEFNKTERILKFRNERNQLNELLFDGFDDPEKIKSIKGITMIWIEEATEFTADDFMAIDLVLREPGPGYHQIILSFNPDESRGKWLRDRFFHSSDFETGPGKDPNSYVHHSTILDNPIDEIRAGYLKVLEDIKDPTYREIYLKGIWAAWKGQIYHWKSVPLPDIKFDEIFYGGDFGYSVNPATVVRIYRKGMVFWVEEVLYEKGLTNDGICSRLSSSGVNKDDPIYWDSAEPKSIQEIYEKGWNAKESLKGPDSVRAGIDFLQSLEIYIVQGSENIEREARAYKWREDKDGNMLAKPEEFEDHSMDAIRYGIFTHVKLHLGNTGVWTAKHDIYPSI